MSVSALIRSAQANRNRSRAYEDQVVKFNFDNSAKTQSDYLEYVSHLDSRAETASDASQALGYEVNKRSAYRTFSSHEIQRQTQSVMAGYSSDEDKYNTVRNLQETAIQMGDLDTAQSLNGQLISLEQRIQNSREAGARAAQRVYERGIKDVVKEYKAIALSAGDAANTLLQVGGLDAVNKIGAEALRETGIIKSLVEDGEITEEQAKNFSTGFFGTQYYMVQDALNQLEGIKAGLAPDDDLIDDLDSAIDSVMNNKFEVPGFRQVTFEEMSQLKDMEAQGVSPFVEKVEPDEITGESKTVLKSAPLVKYTYIQNSDGRYERINNYAQYGDPLFESDSSKEYMTQEQKDERAKQREKVLESLDADGFAVIGDAKGQLQIQVKSADDARRLGISGFISDDGEGGFNIDGKIGRTINLAVDTRGEEPVYTFTDKNGSVMEYLPEEGTVRDFLPTEARQRFDKHLENVQQIDQPASAQLGPMSAGVPSGSIAAGDYRGYMENQAGVSSDDLIRNTVQQSYQSQRIRQQQEEAAAIAKLEAQRRITSRIDNRGNLAITTTPTLDANPSGTLTTGRIQAPPKPLSTPTGGGLKALLDTFKRLGSASSSTSTSDTRVRRDGNTTVVSTTARF